MKERESLKDSEREGGRDRDVWLRLLAERVCMKEREPSGERGGGWGGNMSRCTLLQSECVCFQKEERLMWRAGEIKICFLLACCTACMSRTERNSERQRYEARVPLLQKKRVCVREKEGK